MKLEKYKNLLFEKIKNQLASWFERDLDETISKEEIYRFLHSIKGTAGTIHLVGLEQIATKLIEKLEQSDQEHWTKKSLRDFLYDLIGLSYEYEHFHEVINKSEEVRDENVPLIQIIDDDVSMLVLLKDALENKGWMVMANTEPDRAIEQYFDMQPDCLIIDINLPKKNGFQILEDIQGHNNKRFIPKIMISILSDRDTRINAYKTGADDFIQKPIDLEEFIVRVDRHIQRKQIFDQSVLMDELTQVYNRRFLKDALQRSLNDLKRFDIPFTVAVVDIDHFKKVNDTYGHLVGDKVLATFAQFLSENTRSSDTVFRYGGEEFVILLPKTSDENAKEILTRLLAEMSKKEFNENGQTFSITFSAGVYMVTDSSFTGKMAIHTADQALYLAKENGRARVESANLLEMTVAKKKRLNVSVIDDDAIIRTMLMKILQSMEFEHFELDIAVFEDGGKFFDSNRLDEKGQHFLILDGIMPIMDGTEVLQRVKKLKSPSQFHVLMLTGRKSEYDIARALKLGADDYVTKPFSITELQARIQRLIQRMS